MISTGKHHILTTTSIAIGGAESTPKLEPGQQQLVTNTTVFSAEERRLLDAMVSLNPVNSIYFNAGSTGRASTSRNKLQTVEQPRHKATLVNPQEGNTMVPQGFDQDIPIPVIVGRDTFEEGEEDDIINQCRAEAARKGDLSPMHSGKSKKSRTRDKSWDGKVNEDENVRRLPMRVAKQKKAIQNTSTKSHRSKK